MRWRLTEDVGPFRSVKRLLSVQEEVEVVEEVQEEVQEKVQQEVQEKRLRGGEDVLCRSASS